MLAGKGPPLPFGPRLACGVGLLLAIAGAFASPDGSAVEGLARRVWVPLPDWLVIGAVVAFSLASLIFIALTRPWRRIRREREEDDLRDEGEPVPPLLAALLFVLSLTPAAVLIGAILWFAQSDLAVVSGFGRMMAGGLTAETLPGHETPWEPTSAVTTGLIGALALLAGFGSLALVLWLVLVDRLGLAPGELASPRGPIAAAVEDSLDDLRREPDARTAIIRIYGNFERALADTPSPRRPWQTPVEFMRAVLAKLSLPAAAVRDLTAAFEIARFSRHPVGAPERESAWRSLIEIRDALEKDRRTADAAAP